MSDPAIEAWDEVAALLPEGGKVVSDALSRAFRVKASWPGGSVSATRPTFVEACHAVSEALRLLKPTAVSR